MRDDTTVQSVLFEGLATRPVVVHFDQDQMLGEGEPFMISGQTLLAVGKHPFVTSTGIELFDRTVNLEEERSETVQKLMATIVAANGNVISGLALANNNSVTSLFEFDCRDPFGNFFPCAYNSARTPGATIYRTAEGIDSLRATGNRIDVTNGLGMVVNVKPGATLKAEIEGNSFFFSEPTVFDHTAIRIGTLDRFSTTASSITLSLANNTFNTGAGTVVDLKPGRATDLTTSVRGNHVTNSGGLSSHVVSIEYGISDVTSTLDASFVDNEMRANSGDAIYIWTAPKTTLRFDSNRITGNLQGGISIDTRDGLTTATFTSNTITGNGGYGGVLLRAIPDTGSVLDATFDDNTIGRLTGPQATPSGIPAR